MIRRTPISTSTTTLVTYSTLVRSRYAPVGPSGATGGRPVQTLRREGSGRLPTAVLAREGRWTPRLRWDRARRGSSGCRLLGRGGQTDRKSTRLNSSH